ncbi:hypothetical protein [Botrimarina sp.]|uniref:hypothetical protein n=1 Tax=Botrimarina sp. TaxID=2795802 RepID=UPI0032EFC8DF
MTNAPATGAGSSPEGSQPREEALQEFVSSAGASLHTDSATHVLRGVKLLGLRSRNGRRYLESALGKAIALYEGSKVNVNHPERGPLAPRDYRDRLGTIRNVRMRPGEGLFGDLHYNPRHPLAEQLAWDARHAPENLGLSHNVLARTRNAAGGVIVEAITRVQSVDLVADPATTCGLYEANDRGEGGADPAPGDALLRLREEVDRLKAQVARQSRQALVEQALVSHGVEAGDRAQILSERFARQLIEAASDDDALALIQDRLGVWRRRPAGRPQSQEQAVLREQSAEGGYDGFLAAVTGAAR